MQPRKVNLINNTDLVYADLNPAVKVSDEDKKTFTPNKDKRKKLGGFIIDKATNQLREVITFNNHYHRYNPEYRIQHQKRDRDLVYADLSEAVDVSKEDKETYTPHNKHSLSGYVTDKNKERREVVSRAAFRMKQNRQKELQLKRVTMDTCDQQTYSSDQKRQKINPINNEIREQTSDGVLAYPPLLSPSGNEEYLVYTQEVRNDTCNQVQSSMSTNSPSARTISTSEFSLLNSSATKNENQYQGRVVQKNDSDNLNIFIENYSLDNYLEYDSDSSTLRK